MSSRILVAMSGGVDSSVAAALLVDAGHEVIGVTMKTFCYDETPGPSKTCCGLDGILDARAVADRLDIRHLVFDVEKEFTRDVIDDFVSEYAEGRTPNPCVRCNSFTKFRDLLRRGAALGCDGIATGHYVRSVHDGSGSRLLRGADSNKDQAYFLWGLPSDMLPQLHFPLGNLTKPEVRDIARRRGFVTAEKPESQEICFVPSGDYREFLAQQLRPRHPALESGNLVTTDGRVVGEHDGYAAFTVGQRRGLGGGFDVPHFVLEIRPETREVVVGPREQLEADGLVAGGANWLTDAPNEGDRVDVQIRHRGRAIPATIEAVDHIAGSWSCRFAEPVPAVTPGQSAVVFRGDQVLGGGRIERTVRPNEADGGRDGQGRPAGQYRSSADRANASIA